MKAIQNFLLVVISALCALPLAEAVLRIQEPFLHLLEKGPNAKLTALLVSVQHPLWHHTPRPNAHLTFAGHDPARFPEPVVFRSNAQGCRHDTDLQIPKPAGLNRILVLGDSFTQGSSNNLAETIAPRLEAALKKSDPQGRYEVVNCGFSSYSPILHYIRIRDQFLGFQPDTVIVNVDNTDIYDDYWAYRPLGQFGPDGEPLSVHRSGEFGRWVKETLWYYSYLQRYIVLLTQGGEPAPPVGPAQGTQAKPATAGGAGPRQRFSYFYELPPDSPEWKAEVGFCLDNIERIVKLLRSRGVKVVVTGYPHAQQLPGPGGSPATWNRAFEFEMAALCARLNVPFFSAYDGIAEASRSHGPLYWKDDMHFTPDGERIWSDLVVQWWLMNRARF